MRFQLSLPDGEPLTIHEEKTLELLRAVITPLTGLEISAVHDEVVEAKEEPKPSCKCSLAKKIFSIRVKLPDERVLIIPVNAEEKVPTLFKRISELAETKFKNGRLHIDNVIGKRLRWSARLGAYELTEGSTLVLVNMPPTVPIFVRDLEGEMLELDVKLGWQLHLFKDFVHASTGIPPAAQQYRFNDEELYGNKPLRHYGVQEGAVLQLNFGFQAFSEIKIQ